MKFTPQELHHNVNVSPSSPLVELLILLGALLGIIMTTYFVLGLLVNVIASKMPSTVALNLEGLYSKFYSGAPITERGVKLQESLDKLTGLLPENDRDYKVHLLDHDEENAVALPGKHIIVLSAVLDHVQSENELSFVLAHELGHYANNDHFRGMGRMLVLVTISSMMLGGDNTVTQVLMNSMVNVEMKFSQKQERAADLWAVDLLNRRYGHVGGSYDFLERMAEKEKKSRLSYVFASHPYPLDRVVAIKNYIDEKGYPVEDKTDIDKSN